MSTSLAEQLRRLATPQTTALKDSKKRASILFDPSEAAKKDRETIYDIGISGLKELATLNQSFVQFEDTLFDASSRTFERSVESADINKNLNKSIRKFLFHLSPYFPIQPAHKCLEWLIRRYQIHEYNKDDFIALILPYYSTRMFVRCLQIVRLQQPHDSWHWLAAIQRPGVSLAKQTLFNRLASDAYLLKFVCKFTLDAVKELGTKAHTLQAVFGFYCSSILGGLDAAATITDAHISNLYGTLAKGFASNVSDFCAASIMITGFLVTKARLSLKFLDAIVLKAAKIVHPRLQTDAVVLLILVYEHQADTMRSMADDSLMMLLESKWIPALLGKVCATGIDVLPLYLPLMSACLRVVQMKGEQWRACKLFCENLLMDVAFVGREAEAVIRCILDAYIIRELKENDVINIDSDDDMDAVEFSDTNIDVNQWYSDQLKCLERQYSELFDKVIKEIMQDRSDEKGKSLKTVLGFLFTAACSADGVNIFENLYHYNAENRIAAVQHLIENLESMSFSDDSKDMLKDSIGERINDNSPLVVQAALTFNTDDLVRILGQPLLIDCLLKVIAKFRHNDRGIWLTATEMALDHLTRSIVWSNDDASAAAIFVAVFPFVCIRSSVRCVQIVADSDLAKRFVFFERFRKCTLEDGLEPYFLRQLQKTVNGFPSIDALLSVLKETQPHIGLDSMTATFSILLMTQSIHDGCDIMTLRRIFDTVSRLATMFDKKRCSYRSYLGKGMDLFATPVYLDCLSRIYLSMNYTETAASALAFAEDSPAFALLIDIYKVLLNGMFIDQVSCQLYSTEMATFLKTLFPAANDRLTFCSSFFAGHFLLRPNGIQIEPMNQICTIRLFNEMLTQMQQKSETITLAPDAFIRIIGGLTSPMSAIRTGIIDTLTMLGDIEHIAKMYLVAIHRLIARKEELILDESQLPLILLRIFMPSKSSRDHGACTALLTQFLDTIVDGKKPASLRALTLYILKHVNDSKILAAVAAPALDILCDTDDAPKSKPYFITVYDSIILRFILYRYTPLTIDAIKTAPIVWEVLRKTIENHHVMIESLTAIGDDFDGTVSTCALMIDQWDGQVFDRLLPVHRKQFIEAVIRAATHSENIDVTVAAGKFLRRIELNANVCVDQLQAMRDIRVSAAEPEPQKKGRSATRLSHTVAAAAAVSGEILCTSEWKCGQTWLEHLQNKKHLINAHLVIPYLFDILKKCLDFDSSYEAAEYAKQLTLGCILHCCELISPDGRPKRDLLPDKVFRIDLVVQCIRGTPNPQTHHHALQLLSHTAAMIPEQVLQNMMEIFTFMGSTVVRRDDAYTYQIISNIIKSIIPTLIKSNENKSTEDRDALVIPVLRVFCDIILDVPEHRRVCLYTDLLKTLNVTRYLWMFLVVIFESHVLNYDKDSKTIAKPTKIAKAMAATGYDTKRVTIAVELVLQFDATVAIQTISRLIEFLHKQPFVVVRDQNAAAKMDIDITDTSIFNVDNYTDKQLRHFRYTTLQFLGQLTKAGSGLPLKIAALDTDQMLEMKPYFKDAIVKALQFLAKVIKVADAQNTKYWRQFILHNSYDILEQIIALLSPDMLLQVVGGLMNNIPEVRRKAIELLNKKLQQPGYFANSDPASVLVLLEPFTLIVQSISDESKLIEGATVAESVALQQHALIAVKLLSVTLANDHPESFTPMLLYLSATLKRNTDIPTNVLGQLVLCLAEVCANLRAHAIPNLSKFMPALSKLLQKQVAGYTAALPALLVAMYKIVETLPLFLSPYMVNIIVSLSQIWSRLPVNLAADAQKRTAVTGKLEAIWSKLATVLPMRLLAPMIDHAYNQLCNERELMAVEPCMKLLSESFGKHTNQDIAPFANDLQTFFLRALQFRAEFGGQQMSSIIDVQETAILQSFVGLILKLSESSFRPLYARAYEWALKDDDTSVDRAITFFRLSHRIAGALKSLFMLFANDILANAAELLRRHRNSDMDPANRAKCVCLLDGILQTLHQIFLYDSQGFINHHRFDVLMEPLVDQLDNELVLQTEALCDLVPLCLAELARAANDDVLWKRLNHQILMKTRDNSAEIRQFALTACVEMAKKLGDDFMPLLPETVPFLSELMEDENPDVERHCRTSIRELERTLGESIQKYL